MWRWEAEADVRRTSRRRTWTWRCRRQWSKSPGTPPESLLRPGYGPSSGTYHPSYKLFSSSGILAGMTCPSYPSKILTQHMNAFNIQTEIFNKRSCELAGFSIQVIANTKQLQITNLDSDKFSSYCSIKNCF